MRARGVVIAIVVLAGCLRAPEGAGPSGPEGSLAAALDYALGGCTEALMVFQVDPAQASAHLPAGYVPRDAGGAFGLPADLGRALVPVGAFECAGSTWGGGPLDWGFVGILVEPPESSDAGTSPADLHIYILSYYTGSREQLETLRRRAVPTALVATTVAGATGSTQPWVSAEASDEAGVLYAMQNLLAPGEAAFTPRIHFWHLGARGVALWAFDVNGMERTGGSISCTMRAGSPAAGLVGGTDCTGQAPVAFHHTGMDVAARFMFLPS